MVHQRVLVTGGCGFIGSRLSNHLISQGYEVAIIDNLSLGKPVNLSPDVARKANITTIDVCDEMALTRYLREYSPRVVYHLAALHFIPLCMKKPSACIEINVRGTQAILNACAATSSVESLVLTSSAAVYQPDDQPHSEKSALGPTEVYGYSKLYSEQLVRRFHQKTGISVGIARLFNVYGPGETNPHLLPSIIWQANIGRELRLGNLSTQRDYVFVDDVCMALMRLAEECHKFSVLVCNVGSEKQIDGWHLINLVEDFFGHRFTVHTDSSHMRVNDRPSLVSNCQQAHRLLGWQAETSWWEGLKKTFHQPHTPSFLIVL
jgi:UDP-glucose 4-epimerase